jgi:protocatechuate 3,4-dioxygenase beta subunit
MKRSKFLTITALILVLTAVTALVLALTAQPAAANPTAGWEGSIGGTVWCDANGDGNLNDGEAGIVGVKVILEDEYGWTINTLTDADGKYIFGPGLDPVMYTVTVVTGTLPAGLVPTYDYDGIVVTPHTATFELLSDEEKLNVDFGYTGCCSVECGSLGDYVWEDMNGNGIQDDGNTGMPNVTVKLYLSGGTTPIATASTDASGLYSFTDLMPGDYYVEFVKPSGYYFSPQDQSSDDAKDSDADTTTGQTMVTTLESGENDMTWDAGLYQLASLGDFVWRDLNANGIQDASESGIQGVTVNLYHSDGTLVGTTTTNASGLYSFIGLMPGDYYLVFTKPGADYLFSPKDQGTDDELDSDADTTTGRTTMTTLTSGENDMTWDAGLYQLASIGDFVWRDLNANGIQDAGESGIQGVTVNLYHSDGTLVGTTTTNASGFYSFTGLMPGDYYLVFTKPGADYFFSPQDQGSDDTRDSDADTTAGQTMVTTLESGENDMTWDAGLYQLASLGDYVWEDLNGNGIQESNESGIASVTVELLDASGSVTQTTQTNSSGYYLFPNLKPGTYSVQFVAPSGYTFTLQAQGSDITKDSNPNPVTGTTDAVVLKSGDNNLTIDAGLYQPAPCGTNLCGYIRTPGFWKNYDNHMSAATFLNLIQHTQDFSNLTVEEAVTILSTNNPAPQRFLKFLLTAELNAIWNGQDNAAGLGGQLGTGIYQGGQTVNQLLHQAYLDRNNFTSAEEDYVVYLGSGGEGQCANVCRVQSCPAPPSLAALGDFVWKDLNGNGIQDWGEFGIAGVTVKLLGSDGSTVLATTTTGFYGNYSFTNLAAGTYFVQFIAPSGYTFTTKNAVGSTAANDSNADVTTGKTDAITLSAGQTDNTIDAGLKCTPPPSPAALGDLVWKDANGNGIQDWGEPGIAGVTVKLLGSDGTTVLKTTTTGFYGKYSFTNLAAGTYFVQFIAPSGYTFTTQYAGDAGKDSNANVSTGKTDAITLGAGQTDNTIDAGLKSTTQPPSTNMCAFIRTPGFWKNYSNHMSEATFQAILNATQDYKGTTPAQAVTILSTNQPSFPKFLLSAELNAAWNGQDNSAAPGGQFGLGIYNNGTSSLNGMTVNEVVKLGYLDQLNPTQDEIDAINYLGGGGENVGACACLVH